MFAACNLQSNILIIVYYNGIMDLIRTSIPLKKCFLISVSALMLVLRLCILLLAIMQQCTCENIMRCFNVTKSSIIIDKLILALIHTVTN